MSSGSRFASPALVAGLAVAVLLAADAPPLVLRDGRSVEVARVRVRGAVVEVTLPSGQRLAYLTQDVDLEASGLLGETRQAGDPPPPRVLDMQAARRPDSGRADAALVLTDADVGHVEVQVAAVAPPDPGGDGPVEGEAVTSQAPDLELVDVAFAAHDGVVRVTGAVRNTGEEPRADLPVVAVVTDADGAETGRGAIVLGETLLPGMASRFQLDVAAPGRPHQVAVAAGNTATPADGEAEAPASTPGGTQPAGH